MVKNYHGPVRDEPLAVELHNTLFASRGESFDGLAEPHSTEAWLHAIRDRLPPGGSGPEPRPGELTALRDIVRDVLHVAIEDRTQKRAHIDALNNASARAPRSPAARWRRGAPPAPTVHFHSARRADIVLSALAADTIDLITGPVRGRLRTCGAPGCVLMFTKDHPRREWCSQGCGNRARQARHYRRTHKDSTQ